MSTDFHTRICHTLQSQLQAEHQSEAQRLYAGLRLLGKYRAHLIMQQLLAWGGTTVRSGPFQGLNLGVPVSEGCAAPKLLGCYEQELHAIIATLPRHNYEFVIDVGCAEGYYAVGLAQLLPAARVIACDANPDAQTTCAQLARLNGVESRVICVGEIQPDFFAQFAGRRTFLMCDAEGAEDQLLDPARAPVLREFDILVELHDVFSPGLSDRVTDRFRASHEIQLIPFHGFRACEPLAELDRMENLDRLLAIWEWRSGPTPWAWMKRRG